MRWVPFAVLAIAMLVCQTTVVQAMAIRSIWPNWLFVLAVYYALWGPWPDAAIAAWLLGLAVDLHTLGEPGVVGLYAFLFGGAAWVIILVRQVFYRDHALTQFVLTFGFGLAIELLVELYRDWRVGLPVSPGGLWWPAFFTALYTAAWAPYWHWLLIRLGRWTGLRPAARM